VQVRPRHLLLALVLPAAVLAGGDQRAQAGEPIRPDDELLLARCDARDGRVLLANEQVRIVEFRRYRGDLHICRPGQRFARYFGRFAVLDGIRPSGTTELDLSGPYVFRLTVGEGCSQSVCNGPVGYVIDSRRLGSVRGAVRERRIPGAVDLRVWPDGGLVTIVRPRVNGGDNGIGPGNGRYQLLLSVAGRTTVVAQGTGLLPGSLAVRGNRFFWIEDGQARSAVR